MRPQRTIDVVSSTPADTATLPIPVEWRTRHSGSSDDGKRRVRIAEEDGTVVRLVQYAPGVTSHQHRTNSVDGAVVMSAKMQRETGTVKLNMEPGILHNRIRPCLMKSIMIRARPVTISAADAEIEGLIAPRPVSRS